MEQEERINAYLDGTLDQEAILQLEDQLQTDPEFRILVEEHRKIKQAVKLQERQELRQFLQSIDAESQLKVHSGKNWLRMGLAACLTLVIGYFLWINLGDSRSEKLYEKYYQTYPNLIAPTLRGDRDSSLTSAAFAAYDQADFAKAEALFAKLKESENPDLARFFQGICFLELGKPEEALRSFQQVSATSKNPDKTTAQWYEALTYLLLDQQGQAKSLLTGVKGKPNHPLQPQAQNLWNSLE